MGLAWGQGRVDSLVDLDGWFVILNECLLLGPRMRVCTCNFLFGWFLVARGHNLVVPVSSQDLISHVFLRVEVLARM